MLERVQRARACSQMVLTSGSDGQRPSGVTRPPGKELEVPFVNELTFLVASFVIAPDWKSPKRLSSEEGINEW